MHMAFEAAANKARVCFIGTPHKDMSFTPAQWELMEPQGVPPHRQLDELLRALPRQGVDPHRPTTSPRAS